MFLAYTQYLSAGVGVGRILENNKIFKRKSEKYLNGDST